MSSVIVARPLTVSGNERSLTFTGLDAVQNEVFRAENVMFGSQYLEMAALEPGESSRDFPIWGGIGLSADTQAFHLAPGQFIQGVTTTQAKATITVDDPLIVPVELPFHDITLAKWDLVAPSARDTTRGVVELMNGRAFRILLNAARGAAVSGVHNGGIRTVRTGSNTVAGTYAVTAAGAALIESDFADQARLATEAFWPKNGRIAFVSPYLVEVMSMSARFSNRDYVQDRLGISMIDLAVGMLMGWQIVPVTWIPQAVGGTVGGYKAQPSSELTKYMVVDTSASTTTPMLGDVGSRAVPAALFMSMASNGHGALGAVTHGGLMHEIYRDPRYHTWLIKSWITTGFGVINPFLAGELGVSTSA